MNKKAQIKTIEALIAITFTFAMLAYIIPTQNLSKARDQNTFPLSTLNKNDDFRQCVTAGNASCINDTIKNNLPAKYSFTFNTSTDPNAKTSPPAKTVFADSIIIAGNTTEYKPTIIRLYYWTK